MIKYMIDSYDTSYFDDQFLEYEKSRLSKTIELEKDNIIRSFNYININDPKIILDIGCGTGEVSFLLSQFYPNSTVIGIDREKRLIDNNCKQYLSQKNLKFICEDCYNLPFKDNSIDICYCRYIFQHINKKEILLHELKRILKNNGKLAIFDISKNLNIIYPKPRHLQKFLEAEKVFKKIIKNDIFIGEKLYTMLSINGFKKIKVENMTVDNSGIKRGVISELIKLWRDLSIKTHPYTLTKKITQNEINEYFNDLILISKNSDSYISFGSMFFIGEKEE